MKVLELCLSHGVGGLELYALRTAGELIRRNHDCVAVVRENTMLSGRMQQEGVRTFLLRRRSRFLPLLAARRLAAIIETEAADVLHMHWGPDLDLAVLAKRFAKRKVKLVYTRQMMLSRSKKDLYHRFLYRHVDLFLTISRQLRDKAVACLPLPEKAIRLLYYGVPQPVDLSVRQRRSLRRELGVPDGTGAAIGLVGRMEDKKGQHLLIEALHILRKQGLAAHATFIGPVMDSDYSARLQEQVTDWGLQAMVTFYGSHDNPIELMAAFDIVVLATKRETFGLVLIEAMRSGVAVVGSNAGGVPEIIEDGVSGLLFEPGNAVDLAAKLRRYCTDIERRDRIAAAGKARADRLFSLERHYQHLNDLLRTVAAAPDAESDR